MADEPKTTEPKQTTEQPSTPDEERRVPESALRKQADDFAKAKADLEAKLKKYEDKQAEDERKRLEEQGEWQKIAEAEKAKAEQLSADFAAKERRLKLEAKLAGITNEYAREGAIAKCPADMEVEDYVKTLQKEAPHLFEAPGIPGAGAPSAQSGRGPGGQEENWAQIEEDMYSKDLKRVEPAVAKFTAYTDKHGEYPPGWKRRR